MKPGETPENSPDLNAQILPGKDMILISTPLKFGFPLGLFKDIELYAQSEPGLPEFDERSHFRIRGQ